MKPLYTLILLVATTATHAQRPTALLDNRHLMPEAKQILAEQIAAAHKTAKITAAKSRVIAATETITGSSTDSFTYLYSGNRGSGKILMGYGVAIGFSDNGDAFVNADSMSRYSTPPMMPNAPLVFGYGDKCTYDASDRILSQLTYGGSTNKYKFSYTYDAAGYNTRMLTSTSPLALNNFTDELDEHFRHNALHQVVLDSMYLSWAGYPNWRRLIYYDASNRKASSARYVWNATTSSWFKQDSMVYTYYPNNLLKTSVSYWYGSSVTGTKDSFGYAGSNPLNTYSLSFNSSAGGPWIPEYQSVNTLRPGGENWVSQMVTLYTGSAYAPYEKILGFFNADSTVRRSEFYHYTSGTQQTIPYRVLNYYYQQGSTTPPTSVAFMNGGEALGIYPNPAGEYVMVPLPAMKGPARLEVWDAAGRRILSKACATTGTERLNMSQSPAGWYGVKVWSEDGVMVGSGRFVKR